jgi:hypothetical protein
MFLERLYSTFKRLRATLLHTMIYGLAAYGLGYAGMHHGHHGACWKFVFVCGCRVH